MRRLLSIALLLMAQPALSAHAASADIVSVPVTAETTPGQPDSPQKGDADDPAVWLHPADPGRSLIITTAKEAGLRVYDLQGRLVQRIDAAARGAGTPGGRYNNVDVVYGVAGPDGSRMDIAVASDRGRDRILVWRIDGNRAVAPLTDITAPDQPQIFPTRRAADGSGEIANPVKDQHTAYGLTTWHDPASDAVYAIVAQRKEARLAQQRLVVRPDGLVTHVRTRQWDFPYSHAGQDLTAGSKTDPDLDWSPQFEGLAVDAERGILFAGQEDVGLWRVDLRSGTAETAPFYEAAGTPKSPFHRPDSRLVRDVEGLTIFYGPDGSGYLLVSSQGAAHGDHPGPDVQGRDDSFAVFERAAPNRYLGSFRLTAANGIDAVQECDGADVTSVPLPGYPGGLLITQDGYNDDLNGLSGKPAATNFKFTAWDSVARAMNLTVPSAGFDPRKPVVRP